VPFVMDTSINVAASELKAFLRKLEPQFDALAAKDSKAAYIVATRFLPKGGGIVATNAECDTVAVDFQGPRSDDNVAWVTSVMDSLYEGKFRVFLHTGKSVWTHPLFKEGLTMDQRVRFRAVRQKYDPHDKFDCGLCKWGDMYSLDVTETK